MKKDLKLLEVLDEPGLNKDILKAALGLVNKNTIFVGKLPPTATIENLRVFFT